MRRQGFGSREDQSCGVALHKSACCIDAEWNSIWPWHARVGEAVQIEAFVGIESW